MASSLQESLRPLAIDCIRAVSERLQDPAAVSAFALSLIKILEGGGEGGKVRCGHWEQRTMPIEFHGSF